MRHRWQRLVPMSPSQGHLLAALSCHGAVPGQPGPVFWGAVHAQSSSPTLWGWSQWVLTLPGQRRELPALQQAQCWGLGTGFWGLGQPGCYQRLLLTSSGHGLSPAGLPASILCPVPRRRALAVWPHPPAWVTGQEQPQLSPSTLLSYRSRVCVCVECRGSSTPTAGRGGHGAVGTGPCGAPSANPASHPQTSGARRTRRGCSASTPTAPTGGGRPR